MFPGQEYEDVPPEFPGYGDDERDVFRYHDGHCERAGDPFAIRRRLDACLGNVNRVLADCHVADPPARPADYPGDQPWPPADWSPPEAAVMHAAEAKGRLLDAVRVAFEMAPFEATTGTGALESHCEAAFVAYSAFCAKKKPSAASTPT